jgi:hypothetical protein
MKRGSWGLLTGMVGLLAAGTWASNHGWGIPRPARQPVSIREGSARGATAAAGHYRTRYFIGGGMHRGK